MAEKIVSSAVLSVRLPAVSRDRLKMAAAARGETVQDLIGGLVQHFLAEETRQAPELAATLGALRARAGHLRERGVTGLWVYGSVARGEARPGEAVDLLVEFAADARLSLVGLASLRAELAETMGARADLVERATLLPEAQAAIERDAIRVL
jgi:predicted nucleotidyltransferase